MGSGEDRPLQAAMRDPGAFLGFGSQCPEKEIGKGPDNLWAVGGLNHLVIECKSGLATPQISKTDCNQLIGSMSWFTTAYDAMSVDASHGPVNQ